jgi:hypothetical protein
VECVTVRLRGRGDCRIADVQLWLSSASGITKTPSACDMLTEAAQQRNRGDAMRLRNVRAHAARIEIRE